MRLFIAAPVSPAIRKILASKLDRLRAGLPANAIKWVPPENLHLTLRFLGETPATAVDAITARLHETCADFQAMDVRVSGLGCFPEFARPRVIWVGLQDGSGLEGLQQAIEEATTEFGERGEGDHRRQAAAFHPHLTLGRVKNIPPPEVRRLGLELEQWNLGELGVWKIDRVALMQSVLSPSGPNYGELASIILRSN